MEYPALEGFYMPAEWEPHDGCWIAWPCRIDLWRERYDNVCVNYAQVIRAIARYEPVKVLAPPGLGRAIRLQLGQDIDVLEVVLDDSWFRDNGPTFLKDGKGNVAGVSWHFNGWGNKVHVYEADDRASDWLLDHLDLRYFDGAMVLEGGAIDVDGAGTLLTTEPAVLNPNRNPTLDRQQIEERLAMFLGVRQVVWLPCGLSDDDTDGHVDNVARFAGARHVICAETDDENDRNFNNLQKIRKVLDQHDFDLTILPMPTPERGEDGRQFARSYLNYYLANGAVIVPAFDDAADKTAQSILAEAYPGRDVVGVDISEISRGGGGIHCITQQQPSRH